MLIEVCKLNLDSSERYFRRILKNTVDQLESTFLGISPQHRMELQGNLYSDADANVPRITRSSRRYLDQGARSERSYGLKRTWAGKANVTKLLSEGQQLMLITKTLIML